jgi:uncharacterized protein with FMN-binding domain
MNTIRGGALVAARISIFASLGILLCVSLSACFDDDIKALVIAYVKPTSIMDGVYEGTQDNAPVMAKVRVEVKDGRIDSIEVLKHTHGPNKGAEAIVGRVLAAQSLEVDAVSGATLSSKVVLKAIERALDKGLR